MGLLETLAEPAARHGAPRGTGQRTPWGARAATRDADSSTSWNRAGTSHRPPRAGLAVLLSRPGLSRRGRPGSPASRQARRILWRWRFALAAALFGLAATLTVHLLRPPPPPTVDVAVTARAVAPGTQLTRADVAVRAVAADLAPPGALHSVRAVLGRAAVVGLPEGAPLHTSLVSDDGVSAAAPRGTVVVPVRLSDDAVAALLRPGDRVDLLAGTTSGSEPDGEPRYLARGARVLPVPAGREPKDAGGLLGPVSDGEGPVTLVAVTPEEAPELSAVSGWGSVTAVLVP
ncbi:RcpC/CpaB family pilus assembly protein [Promicromonospora sp. NPDC019610]|uniref:RcpC/CpaB family pilus assembly protein n=1 Tax=Promicromonospora sp. NPDC019610 TaxID=3364405 RepID=UPI0037A2CDF4